MLLGMSESPGILCGWKRRRRQLSFQSILCYPPRVPEADAPASPVGDKSDKPWRHDPIWLAALTARRTDYTRAFVTWTLMITFAGTLGFGAWVTVAHLPAWQSVKDYLNLALPAITGLLGSAMGFYFGSAAGTAAAAASQAATATSKPGATQTNSGG
jgi:hypothetical protein